MADNDYNENDSYVIYKNKNKKTGLEVEVRRDPHSERNRIVHTHDLRQQLKQCKTIRDATTFNQGKSTSFFNENHNDGDRLIAKVPTSLQQFHPELFNEDGSMDDVAFFKWLDANPQFKILDVGWTHVKHKRNIISTSGKDKIIG